MIFADYLSHNLHGSPIPPSDRDTNFVISTVNDFKNALIGNNLAPNGASHNKANKRNDTKHDVTNTKHAYTKSKHAFRLSTLTNKFHSFNTNYSKSNYIHNSKPVNITTRSYPHKDTHEIPIRKRFRAKNRIPNPQMEN